MSNVTHVDEACHTREWVKLQTRISHVTHITYMAHEPFMNESRHTYQRIMANDASAIMENSTHDLIVRVTWLKQIMAHDASAITIR